MGADFLYNILKRANCDQARFANELNVGKWVSGQDYPVTGVGCPYRRQPTTALWSLRDKQRLRE